MASFLKIVNTVDHREAPPALENFHGHDWLFLVGLRTESPFLFIFLDLLLGLLFSILLSFFYAQIFARAQENSFLSCSLNLCLVFRLPFFHTWLPSYLMFWFLALTGKPHLGPLAFQSVLQWCALHELRGLMWYPQYVLCVVSAWNVVRLFLQEHFVVFYATHLNALLENDWRHLTGADFRALHDELVLEREAPHMWNALRSLAMRGAKVTYPRRGYTPWSILFCVTRFFSFIFEFYVGFYLQLLVMSHLEQYLGGWFPTFADVFQYDLLPGIAAHYPNMTYRHAARDGDRYHVFQFKSTLAPVLVVLHSQMLIHRESFRDFAQSGTDVNLPSMAFDAEWPPREPYHSESDEDDDSFHSGDDDDEIVPAIPNNLLDSWGDLTDSQKEYALRMGYVYWYGDDLRYDPHELIQDEDYLTDGPYDEAGDPHAHMPLVTLTRFNRCMDELEDLHVKMTFRERGVSFDTHMRFQECLWQLCVNQVPVSQFRKPVLRATGLEDCEFEMRAQGIFFSTPVPPTPETHIDYDGEQMPMSPCSFGDYDMVSQSGQKGRVAGVFVFGEFVPVHTLRAIGGCRDGTRPDFVPGLGHGGRVSSRTFCLLQMVDSSWLRRMARARYDSTSQGLTISCPKKISVDLGLRRLLGYVIPATPIVPTITFSEYSDEEMMVPQAGGEEDSPWRKYIQISYGLIRGGMLFLDRDLGLPEGLLLDALGAMNDILGAGNETMVWMIAIDRFMRRWLPHVLELGVALQDIAQSLVSDAVTKILEAVGVIAICRVGGITKDLADFKTLSVFLKEHVIGTAHNIVEYLLSCIKVLSTGSFEDFWNRVQLTARDSETQKLKKLSIEFDQFKGMDFEPNGVLQRLTQLDLMERRALDLERQALAYDREMVAVHARVLATRISTLSTDWRGYAESRGMRKEPIIFLGYSKAGTGKSMLSVVMENAISRALKVTSEEGRYLIYNWAMGEKFQEGWQPYHRAINVDEFLSVNPDMDSQAAAACYNILQLGSSNPFVVPKAFETKGKHTSSGVLAVVVNSNAHFTTIKNMYSGAAENFFRRVIVVKMVPRGDAEAKGSFRPDLVPEENFTLEHIGEVMDVVAEKIDPETFRTVGEPLFQGNILEFCDWVTAEVESRVDGRYQRIGKWLTSLRGYKIDSTAQASFGDGFVVGIFVVFFLMTYGKILTHLLLLAPRVWKMYWLYLWTISRARLVTHQCSVKLKRVYGVAPCREDLNRTAMLVYEGLRHRWRMIYENLRVFCSSSKFQAAMALCVVGGVATVAYKGVRQVFSPALQVDSDAQAFKMPLQVTPEVGADLPVRVREFCGEMVPVLELVKGTGPLKSMVPAPIAGSGGMRVQELDKLRANLVIVELFDGYTDESKSASYGWSMAGVIKAPAHNLPPDKTGWQVRATSILFKGQTQRFDLDDKCFSINRGADEVLYMSLLPSGVKDVMTTLQTKVCAPYVGMKVILLGASPAEDLHGTVCELVGSVHEWKDHTAIMTAGFRVRWLDGKMTKSGHCGRPCLSNEGGGSYGYLGHLVSQKNSDPTVSGIAFDSADDLRRRIVEAKIACGNNFAINSTAQCSLNIVMPSIDMIPEWPTNGVFAYPALTRSFGVEVLGRSSVQVPPGGSKLEKSPFFDKACEFGQSHGIDTNYLPAVQQNVIRYDTDLQANRFVSPYELGMHRNDDPYSVRWTDLREFSDELLDRMKDKVKDIAGTLTMYTIDEALGRQDALAPVDPRKAATLPEPGKKGAFMYEQTGPDGPVRFADERVRTSVQEKMLNYCSGRMDFLVTKASLKDEALPARKIEAVKTRIFEAVAMDSYLLMRMCYGKIIPHLLASLRSFGVCIGINASSSDWNWVHARTHPDVGEYLAAMDYSFFDKRFLYLLHVAFMSVVWRFSMFLWSELVPIEVRTAAALMLMSQTQCVRIVDGAIVVSYAGNPSGGFFTAIDNSGENMFLVFLSYRRVCRTIQVKVFMDRVLAFCTFYGDDLRKKFTAEFGMTLEKLVAAMRTLRQDLTDGNGQKGKLVVNTDGGKTFLKRGFRVVGDRVYCPLEVTSLLKSLLYFEPAATKAEDDDRHFAVLRTLWDEAFFHDDDTKGLLRGLVRDCSRVLPDRYQGQRLPTDEELAVRWAQGSFKVWQL